MEWNPQTFQKTIYILQCSIPSVSSIIFKFSAHKFIVARIQGCDHIFSIAFFLGKKNLFTYIFPDDESKKLSVKYRKITEITKAELSVYVQKSSLRINVPTKPM